jgi:hypothetical protein
MGRCDRELKSGEALAERTMLLGCGRRLGYLVVCGLIAGSRCLMTGGAAGAGKRFAEKRRGGLRDNVKGDESRIKYRADER